MRFYALFVCVISCAGQNPVCDVDVAVFRQQVLAEHNRLRAIHGVPPLRLDRRLNKYAWQWTRHCGTVGILEHRSVQDLQEKNYGETLFHSTGSVKYDGTNATFAMYKPGARLYDYATPVISENTENFSQIIWKSTKRLGCAVRYSNQCKDMWVVCNYSPPGNMIQPGAFEANVLAPGSFA